MAKALRQYFYEFRKADHKFKEKKEKTFMIAMNELLRQTIQHFKIIIYF